MTLVNTETGEVTEALSEAEAERLSNRISLRLDTIADNYAAVMPMIREAIERRAHEVLGYRSPGEYAADRFGAALSKLGPEMRQAVVRELSDLGMSTRAIAPIVGVSDVQVHRDRHAGATSRSTSPDPTTPVVGATPAPPESPKVAPDEERDTAAAAVLTDDSTAATPEAETPAAPRPPVVGIDGKTYSPPTPRPPKPVLDGTDADYANAEKASLSLSRAISKLLEFQHPNMREGMRRYWSMASLEVPPTPRRDVTPEQMRVAAQGLLSLADEWGDR